MSSFELLSTRKTDKLTNQSESDRKPLRGSEKKMHEGQLRQLHVFSLRRS